MSVANKATMRRIFEAYSRHDVSALDELIAPDFVFHQGPRAAVAARGLANYKEHMRGLLTAMPDFRVTVEDMVAERDMVATRLTSHFTQGGKPVTMSYMAFTRLADGKSVEDWVVMESAPD
jgi:ketosteroid isomerase-like protein